MDNIDSLFEKKQYDLLTKLLEKSSDPKERLMRLSCLVILGRDGEALDDIANYQSILEKAYPNKLMKLHFELLLKNEFFDEAKLALRHYNDLPYISQETEEFLADMPKRIEKEQYRKHKQFDIEEINRVLISETDTSLVAEVLFSLKNYNLHLYIDSLFVFMQRSEINVNFRTYAFIILVDNKYDDEVKLLTKDGLKSLNPSKVVPPFSSLTFVKAMAGINEFAKKNVTLEQTAINLLNCLTLDVYPNDIDFDKPLNISKAIVLLAKEYIHEQYEESNKDIIALKNKIKQIVEATPAIKL